MNVPITCFLDWRTDGATEVPNQRDMFRQIRTRLHVPIERYATSKKQMGLGAITARMHSDKPHTKPFPGADRPARTDRHIRIFTRVLSEIPGGFPITNPPILAVFEKAPLILKGQF